MRRPWKIRTVVERFKDADRIERDTLECGHVVIAPHARLSSGTRIYLAPDRRRCYACGALAATVLSAADLDALVHRKDS